jgi:hypothetical protein
MEQNSKWANQKKENAGPEMTAGTVSSTGDWGWTAGEAPADAEAMTEKPQKKARCPMSS